MKSKYTYNFNENEIIEKIDILFGKMERDILKADTYGECDLTAIYSTISTHKNEIKELIYNIFDKNKVEPKKNEK